MYEFLAIEEFKRRFGNLYRSLFCDTYARRASFRHAEWEFLLTSMAPLQDKSRFEELCNAAKYVEDNEIIITNIQDAPEHRWSFVASCDYDEYVAGMRSEQLGLLPAVRHAMFGSAGKWAGILERDYENTCDYVIFGGEQEFISHWASLHGGIQKFRHEFLEHLDWPGLRGWPRQVPREIRDSLLSDVGWL